MSQITNSQASALGDFQTPVELAEAVWSSLAIVDVTHVIEPTVGLGNFVRAAPLWATHIPWYAFDINNTYVRAATKAATHRGLTDFKATCRDAFGLAPSDFPGCAGDSTVLVVGNPPWVTNAAQGAAQAPNVPVKHNRFGLAGLAALTGKSNFDIAEPIMLAVLDALRDVREVRVALLLKRSVAMKVAQDLMRQGGATFLRFSGIDARSWFGAAVDAGLFEMTWSPTTRAGTQEILVRERLGGGRTSRAGIVRGSFVRRLDAYDAVQHVEKRGPVDGPVWRQGLKHDAGRILELRSTADGLTNGLGEIVDVESEVLCPWYKSSDLAHGRRPSRVLPLYQVDLTGPMPDLSIRWPKLARYLTDHREAFEARRSRIYSGKPPFMLFGVGPYTCAPFKVALSGFYKVPRFVVLAPSQHGRPPLVDDTCYFLPFGNQREATAVADYLNGPDVQGFLEAIVDTTAKRPYTVDILRRIVLPAHRRSPEQLSLV